MEINIKGIGGIAGIGMVALSGYVLYLKGKFDGQKEVRDEIFEKKCKEFHKKWHKDL